MLRAHTRYVALLDGTLVPLLERIADKDADLFKQGRRAAQSVALNTGEATGSRRGNRRERYTTARGSCTELMAVLEVAVAFRYIEPVPAVQDELRQVSAILWALIR